MNVNECSAEQSKSLADLLPSGVAFDEIRGAFPAVALHPDENVCVARAVPNRILEFSAGRWCARRALASLGIVGHALLMNQDRSPAWPSGIVGSITHTKGYCAAAVARSGDFDGIGIDAELRGALNTALWPQICTPDELRWLSTLHSDRQREMATLMFCAKEAVYKCQYAIAQRWLDFPDVQLQVGNGAFDARILRTDERFTGQFLFEQDWIVAAVVAPSGRSGR